MSQFLIVQAVRQFPSSALSGVVGIDRFLAERLIQFLQCCWFRAAKEDPRIHVADDRICVVLVDRLELRLRLQHQTGRDLTAADRCNQFSRFGI